MKYFRKLRISLLVLSMLAMMLPQTALAADDAPYPYTIRLLPGNQGALTGAGIEAPGAEQNVIKDSNGNITAVEIKVMSNTNVRVNITAGAAARETDSRYFVRGVKRAGRDNSEEEPSFVVDCDKDYVISYGVRGDTVQYTVNYVDADGNVLLEGGTYYGNVGERQYVSARYIDGYQPDAYNKVMTLKDNEAENVFNFIYTPGETPADETGTATATPGGGPADADAAGADAGAADAAAAEGGAVVPVADEETPQDLVDLDDEETPLANKTLDDIIERAGTRIGYLPVYAVIGMTAAAALILAAIILKKSRKSSVQAEDITEILENIDVKDFEDNE